VILPIGAVAAAAQAQAIKPGIFFRAPWPLTVIRTVKRRCGRFVLGVANMIPVAYTNLKLSDDLVVEFKLGPRLSTI
jgi:hypothetical protein